MKQIFGFGSLLNSSSLLATAANATDIRPAYVKGFRRDFSVHAAAHWATLDPDLAGTSFCALDIQRHRDPDAMINGVCFKVNEHDFLKLKDRECEYGLVGTVVYDFATGEALGNCFLFSSCKNNGSYDFKSGAQTSYLEICLEGARGYGETFYRAFLDTTFIGGKRLSDFPELIKK